MEQSEGEQSTAGALQVKEQESKVVVLEREMRVEEKNQREAQAIRLGP